MDNDFISQYPTCYESGSGYTYSYRYTKSGAVPNPPSLSFTARIKYRNLQLYGIFSGYNGGEDTAKFVMNRMAYEIFQENPISMAMQPHEIVDELKKKFQNIGKRYFELHTDILNERIMERFNVNERSEEIISEIDRKIRQGSTAIVVLKMNADLYIINCGCSLALAITNKQNMGVPLCSKMHQNDDPDEIDRLQRIGVCPHDVLNPTRAIGDLHRSYLYEEKEEFKSATGPPVISEPDVQHCVINKSWKYLVLLSDGVVQNLNEVEIDNIPAEVSTNLKEDNTLTSTSQALVDAFARKHYDAFIRTQEENLCSVSNHREEMAIIIVKLNNHDHNLYETVDSAISTYDSSNNTLDNGPIAPYIDARFGSHSKNLRELETFLLRE